SGISVRGPGVIVADVISGELAIGVDIGFAVRDDGLNIYESVKRGRGAGRYTRGDITAHEFILSLRVVGRRGNRDFVRGILGEAKAEVIGLQPLVTLPDRAAVVRIDQRQQAARGISRQDIRIVIV